MPCSEISEYSGPPNKFLLQPGLPSGPYDGILIAQDLISGTYLRILSLYVTTSTALATGWNSDRSARLCPKPLTESPEFVFY